MSERLESAIGVADGHGDLLVAQEADLSVVGLGVAIGGHARELLGELLELTNKGLAAL